MAVRAIDFSFFNTGPFVNLIRKSGNFGLKAFHIGFKNPQIGGIIEIMVTPSMNIFSETLALKDSEKPNLTLRELLHNYTFSTPWEALDSLINNPQQIFSGFSTLRAPWTSPLPEQTSQAKNKFIAINFLDEKCLIPANDLNGLLGIEPFDNIHTHKEETSITITGSTEITNWFSPLKIKQIITLTSQGELIRSAEITNLGEKPTPVALGDLTYFRMPENQKRSDVRIYLPALKVIMPENDSFLTQEEKLKSVDVKNSCLNFLLEGGKLGETSIEGYFFDFFLNQQKILAPWIFFPEENWGIRITTSLYKGKCLSGVNLLAPKNLRFVALGFGGNIPGTFENMEVLEPQQSLYWRIKQSIIIPRNQK